MPHRCKAVGWDRGAQRVSMTITELDFEIFSGGEQPLILCHMSFLPELGLLPPIVHAACNVLSLHFLSREGLR